jgi:hypothetical protein
MFYGHCVMLLENYKNTSFSKKPVAAWSSGNERISHQMNLMRHLELRNLFKYPPSKVFKEFISLKPREIVRQGSFLLTNHINHPAIGFINKNECRSKKERILLKVVRTINFNSRIVLSLIHLKNLEIIALLASSVKKMLHLKIVHPQSSLNAGLAQV